MRSCTSEPSHVFVHQQLPGAELGWVSTLTSPCGGTMADSLFRKGILLDVVLNFLWATHTPYCVSFSPNIYGYMGYMWDSKDRILLKATTSKCRCLHECIHRHNKCLTTQWDTEGLGTLLLPSSKQSVELRKQFSWWQACPWLLNAIWYSPPGVQQLVHWGDIPPQSLCYFGQPHGDVSDAVRHYQISFCACVLATISSPLSAELLSGLHWLLLLVDCFSSSMDRHQGMMETHTLTLTAVQYRCLVKNATVLVHEA